MGTTGLRTEHGAIEMFLPVAND